MVDINSGINHSDSHAGSGVDLSANSWIGPRRRNLHQGRCGVQDLVIENRWEHLGNFRKTCDGGNVLRAHSHREAVEDGVHLLADLGARNGFDPPPHASLPPQKLGTVPHGFVILKIHATGEDRRQTAQMIDDGVLPQTHDIALSAILRGEHRG